MFRKIWYWLNEVRYFDVPVPQFIYKIINKKALLEEARIRMQIMKEEMLKKRIIDYYETVDIGTVDILPVLKADQEIKRLKRSGDFNRISLAMLEDEVA